MQVDVSQSQPTEGNNVVYYTYIGSSSIIEALE